MIAGLKDQIFLSYFQGCHSRREGKNIKDFYQLSMHQVHFGHVIDPS